jgi:protein involved in polysaccharide export with SLBB domain
LSSVFSVLQRQASASARRAVTLAALSLAALGLAGCQSGPQYSDVPGLPTSGTGSATVPVATTAPPAAAAPQTPPSAPGTAGIDIMHRGDLITVSFSDLPYVQPPLDRRIAEDGTINLIENETFTAADKTPGQLEKEIRERYVPRKFLKLTVSVMPQKDTQFYYVGGEVKNPGRQVYISRIKVLGAIKSAGDFTDFANKKKVQLTRTDGRTFIINCKDALKNPTLDLEVFPGDNINVPRKPPFSLF